MLMSVLLTAISQADQSADWTKDEETLISCEEYVSYEIPQGILTNNVWNKHAAHSDDWSQCLKHYE